MSSCESELMSHAALLSQLQTAATPAQRQPLLDALLRDDALRGATLTHCDLSGAALPRADLCRADFQHSDLSGADLTAATLHHTGLRWANLSGANLQEADCSGAFLWEANCSGTMLRGACFAGASLIGTHFDTADWQTGHITLPDGTRWTAETDLRRFSDPRHPDYEAALGATNTLRLRWGVPLLGKHDAAHRLYYPLPGERLNREAMRARVAEAARR